MFKIVMFGPKGERGVPTPQETLPLSAQEGDKIYGIGNLPDKHSKKYMFVHTNL